MRGAGPSRVRAPLADGAEPVPAGRPGRPSGPSRWCPKTRRSVTATSATQRGVAAAGPAAAGAGSRAAAPGRAATKRSWRASVASKSASPAWCRRLSTSTPSPSPWHPQVGQSDRPPVDLDARVQQRRRQPPTRERGSRTSASSASGAERAPSSRSWSARRTNADPPRGRGRAAPAAGQGRRRGRRRPPSSSALVARRPEQARAASSTARSSGAHGSPSSCTAAARPRACAAAAGRRGAASRGRAGRGPRRRPLRQVAQPGGAEQADAGGEHRARPSEQQSGLLAVSGADGPPARAGTSPTSTVLPRPPRGSASAAAPSSTPTATSSARGDDVAGPRRAARPAVRCHMSRSVGPRATTAQRPERPVDEAARTVDGRQPA